MKKFYEEILESGEYYIHHQAMAIGYMSKEKDYKCEEYYGKFGKGFKIHRANANFPVRGKSRRYHWVEYIIKKA
nr:hypothetical protein QQAWYXWE_QQAWYXWE_CDS_0010 [Microvirus sp.]